MLQELIIPVVNVEKIMSIFYFEFAKNFHSGIDKHNFWEIVYVDKGEITITADGQEHVIHQGEAIFHKPNEGHSIKANDDTTPNVFIISFVCTSKAMQYFENRILEIPTRTRKIITLIIEETGKTCYFPLLINKMRQDEYYQVAPIGSMQMIKLYLEQFLILLLRDGQEAQSSGANIEGEDSGGELVHDMIFYLENHIYQAFTVGKMCHDFNYSATYLSKIFKKTTGMSILDYYLHLKMIEARRMIREGNMNIAQIAQKLGYDSPQYFSRSFKRIAGMKPQEYKKSVFEYGEKG